MLDNNLKVAIKQLLKNKIVILVKEAHFKIKMNFKLLLILFIVNITLVNAQHTHNVDIERQLHDIVNNYHLSEKISTQANIQLNSEYEVSTFNRFVKKSFSAFYRETYHKLLANQINLSQVETLYTTEVSRYINNTNVSQAYTSYKNNIPQINDNDRRPVGRTPNIPCTNLDFETGDWTSWNPFIGDACDGYIGCITGVTPGTGSNGGTPQHLIMGAGMDPDVPIPTLSPFGGANSLRLGNLDASGYAEQIQNIFLVTADKPYFSYEYAVVIENPTGHDPEEMPFFMVEFFDQTGTTITGTCGNYYVDPTTQEARDNFDSIQVGFQWMFYKDWARVTVDLTPYIGQNVTIKFTTSDCTLSGHLGRAYLDAECSDAKIDIVQDCQGIRLQAPPGYSKYIWDTGNPADTIDHIYIDGPGGYSVELISETGCSITVDTVANELYVKLNHQVNYIEPKCNGGTDGEITVSAFGGTAPYRFSVDNGTTWQASNKFTGLTAGTYDVITEDSYGCNVVTNNIQLTEPPAIFPNLIITDVICFGDCNGTGNVAPIGGTSPNGIYNVEWNGQNYNSNSIANLCPGNYTLRVIDEIGCEITQNFPINEPPATVINQVIVDDEICYNNCDGKITINDPNAVQYSVDNGFTYSSNNVFSNLCAQAAPYTVAIKDAKGCVAKQTVGMNQPPQLQINISNDTTICLNGTATIDANVIGGTNPIDYQWANGKNTQVIYESPKEYAIYAVVATDANGCWVADQMEVDLYPQPKADFDYSPGPETDVFHPLIQFTNTSQSAGPLTYEWYFDTYGTSSLMNDYFEFPSEGGQHYEICLKVENQYTCRDSICKPLFVNYETLLYVPNAFTPDGDGVNDIFIPSVEGLDESRYKLLIFNRWGDLIFETDNTIKGWDGTFNNKPVADDTYVWRIISRELSNQAAFERIGHIILVR